MLSNQQQAHSRNVAKLIEYIYAQGYSCSLGEAWRSPEQAALYAKEGKGIVDSLHCDRLAIDLNLFSPSGVFLSNVADYSSFGAYWETLDPHNRWGGRFKRVDADHFEYNPNGVQPWE